MRIKRRVSEDFSHYYKISYTLYSISCDFKCCAEQNIPFSMCQNEPWVNAPVLEISIAEIIQEYLDNPFPNSLVIAGLEPMMQFEEMLALIKEFRKHSQDDVVIFTGHNKEEIAEEIAELRQIPNIIVKFGRYLINYPPHFDEVLGVELASPNQYAEKIS